MGLASWLGELWRGRGARDGRWRLFVRFDDDGAVTGTLVNFAAGEHRRMERGTPEQALAFLRRNAVDLGSVRLMSPVRCALQRQPAGWHGNNLSS